MSSLEITQTLESINILLIFLMFKLVFLKMKYEFYFKFFLRETFLSIVSRILDYRMLFIKKNFFI